VGIGGTGLKINHIRLVQWVIGVIGRIIVPFGAKFPVAQPLANHLETLDNFVHVGSLMDHLEPCRSLSPS
jgi:hypothetical protein